MPSLIQLWLIYSTIVSVVGISVTAFIAPIPNVIASQYVHQSYLCATSSGSSESSSTATATSAVTNDPSPIAFVENLLQQLSSPDATTNKGEILLEASSDKWRQAIYQAIGAPTTATTDVSTMIAKSLQDKMSRSDSQFAILMGTTATTTATTPPFTISFPSDIVDYRNDGTVWLECQLRHADTNKLFVIMGMSLIADEVASSWKILSLDWQDFREPFYPGLSGREWLRAF